MQGADSSEGKTSRMGRRVSQAEERDATAAEAGVVHCWLFATCVKMII